MSLLLECRQFFDDNSRIRGDEYFRKRRVRILGVDSDRVCAKVTGTAGYTYEVDIDLSNLPDHVIVGECTCPRFNQGDLCKHIWATLRQIQQQKVIPDEYGLVDLVLLHAHESVEDEDEDDDNDIIDARWTRAHRLTSNRPAALSSPPNRTTATWHSLVPALARDDASERPAAGLTRQVAVPRQTQAWFVVDIGVCLQRGGLLIDLYQRESQRDGHWGKIKPLRLQRGSTGPLSDPEDRRLVGLLMGNEPENPTNAYPSYYGSYHGYQNYSRILVVPAMYDLLLPKLSATGRLVWSLDSSIPPEEGRPLAWDDGDPWRVRLHVDSELDSGDYGLRGELFRDGQSRPLNDPVLMLAHGLVVFPDLLARLDAAEHFSWIAALRKNPRIAVPRGERQAFFEWLWGNSRLPTVELPDDLQVEHVQGVPRGKLSIQSPDRFGRSSYLFAQVRFLYEDQFECSAESRRGVFLDADPMRVIHRDMERERALVIQLAEAGLERVPAYQRGTADVQFPLRKLAELVEHFTARGWWVESEGRLLRRAGGFHLNVTSDVDWFEVDGRFDFDGVEVPLPRLLAALRSRQKYVRLDDGTQGILPDEWLKRFGSLVDLGEQEDDKLRFRPSQALLLDALLAAQDDAVTVDASFDRLRKQLRSFDGIQPGSEPRGFQGQLRGYQRDGLGWLDFLRTFRFGGCLADDMGLGKTIQVLALLQARRTRKLKQNETRRPSIVVVPKSLVFNWIDEASRFTPRLRLLDYTGTGRHATLPQLDDCDLLITTYGTLRRDIVKLKDLRFDYAILDESQAVKNANSQASKACRLLQADHRLAMTGTPVENHLGELWALFEFLNPGILGRSSTFQTLMKQNQDDGQSLRLLSQSLRPFFLRRTKEQVLTELPEKSEQTLYCEMAPKQRKLYDELREYYRASLKQRVEQVGLDQAKIHVLEALLRLRQAACHPGLLDAKRATEPSAKMELLLEQLQEVVAEGHKALVFSQFTSLLALVRKALDQRKIAYEYLDGQTRQRKDCVQRFQKDPHCPLFLLSLKAGGYGLNLTAADYVFILDPWWNPAVESQAIDRAHRLGQTRHVFAYRLICRDTVEEKILELQRSKRDLADAIISEDNSLIRQLTAEDLQLLLS
jgi:superfamily II DNA or RNA helicase